MKIDYTGRGVDITNRVRNFTESKFERITKLLEHVHDIDVVLSVEKYRHKAEIKFQAMKRTFHGTDETNDMFQSIDRVIDKLEAQARKFKDKNNAKKRNTTEPIRKNGETVDSVVAEPEGTGELRVIRNPNPVRPMSLDEAVDALGTLDNEFIIYRDAESDAINVVYRRKDGHVGLIDP